MIARDLRYALRSIRKNPGFSLAAILTLALGIGANTAIFSLIHGVLLEPLPYRDGEDLVVLRQSTADVQNVPFSIAEFFDYRDQAREMQLVEYHSMSFTLLGQGEPQRVSTGVVSHDFFDVLGVAPAQGRFFAEADETHGAEAVLILSHGYWQKHFGGDPGVVGRVFQMNNRPHTVVGVLPPIPQFPNEHDIYMPTSACPFRAAGQQAMFENRGAFRGLTVFGRLLDDSSVSRADSEVAGLAQRFSSEYPETYEQAQGFGASASPLQEELTKDARPMLWMLLATTALVLLLACMNVANLTLARLIRRQREMAIRASLGASRSSLVGQVTVESALLALAGAVVGLGVAYAGLELLVHFTARFTPRAIGIEINGTVLLFTLFLAVGASLLFGAVPAAGQRIPLAGVVRESSRSSASKGKLQTRGALVVLQVAASVVLLVGAGLLLRSFNALQQVDPGFDPENVISARVSLNWSKYTDRDSRVAFFDRLLDELEGHPGVVSAAIGSVTPLSQNGGNTQNFQIEGRPPEEGVSPTLDVQFVTEGLFRTLGIPLERGRLFDSRDHATSPATAVVSHSLAKRHWPNEDPIGRRLSMDGGQSWTEIVGVVGDVRQYGLDQAATQELYRPLAQTGNSNRIFVRTRAEPATMVKDLKQAVLAVDPEQPIDRLETLQDTRDASLATPKTSAMLLTLFAGLALAITATGVGSVMAWSVGQRTQEIGVRMALGAKASTVWTMVLMQGLRLVFVGLAIGLVGALAFGHLLSAYLFQTETYDPITLALVTAVLIAAAGLACGLPALRAVRIKPSVALRGD